MRASMTFVMCCWAFRHARLFAGQSWTSTRWGLITIVWALLPCKLLCNARAILLTRWPSFWISSFHVYFNFFWRQETRFWLIAGWVFDLLLEEAPEKCLSVCSSIEKLFDSRPVHSWYLLYLQVVCCVVWIYVIIYHQFLIGRHWQVRLLQEAVQRLEYWK